MLGTGLQTIYNVLGGPSWEETKDLYGTYDEGYKDPELYKDIGKFSANTLKDIVQFFPDVALNLGKVGIAGLVDGKDRPVISTKGKYLRDAFFHNTLGDLSWYDWESNPYTNPEIQEELKQQSGDYADAYVRDNVVTESGEKKARAAANKKITWNKWIKDNPNVPEGEGGYEKYMDDFYEARDNKFFEELWNTYGSKWDEIEKEKYDDLLRVNYGIGADESRWSEFELGKNFDYAWEGKPLFDYDPRRAETFEKAHGISDLVGGFGLAKVPSKIGRRLFKGSKRADEGIMGVKRIEDADKYRYAEEWLRTGGR